MFACIQWFIEIHMVSFDSSNFTLPKKKARHFILCSICRRNISVPITMMAPEEETKGLAMLFKGAVIILPGVDLDRCVDTKQSISSSCLLPLRLALPAVLQELI
jgi:hypothetical protein